MAVFDWGDVFAEFRITYPSLDPLECTIAVFEAYFIRIVRNKKWVDGRWGDYDSHQNMVDTDNRKILMQARFPCLFPPVKFSDDNTPNTVAEIED